MMDSGFHVYLLRCSDGSYYAGHTEALESRLAEHQRGEIVGFTASRLPVEPVWSQAVATREEALDSERRIKGWSRAKKEALIRGDWEAVRAHARSRSAAATPTSVHPSTGSGRTDDGAPGHQGGGETTS